MNANFTRSILQNTGARSFEIEEVLQELWSGYGQIVRLRLLGGSFDTVVAKHIALPDETQHPRGWNTDRSHRRKVRSYEVETRWYRDYNQNCDDYCPTPRLLGYEKEERETLLLLEDLDAKGYPKRLSSLSQDEVLSCLRWLASFHATFLQEGEAGIDGLWEEGTYWHLATRPDELAALEDEALKKAAPLISETLRQARFQTLVHGDAKVANFCFSDKGSSVAALDFQYVGGGCGMKDVAYFLGSCLDEVEMASQEEVLLEYYFTSLRAELVRRGSILDYARIESEWRELFFYAWADFHRFLQGWSPTHWKLNSYGDRLVQRVVGSLHF